MNDLPEKCTCPISNKEKTRKYFDSALRECELCLAILNQHLNGYKPQMRSQNSLLYAESLMRDGALFTINFIVPFVSDWRRHRTFILLDYLGQPLYRKTLNRLGVHLRKGDTLSINWVIGKGD
jgi:hypothetical protein